MPTDRRSRFRAPARIDIPQIEGFAPRRDGGFDVAEGINSLLGALETGVNVGRHNQARRLADAEVEAEKRIRVLAAGDAALSERTYFEQNSDHAWMAGHGTFVGATIEATHGSNAASLSIAELTELQSQGALGDIKETSERFNEERRKFGEAHSGNFDRIAAFNERLDQVEQNFLSNSAVQQGAAKIKEGSDAYAASIPANLEQLVTTGNFTAFAEQVMAEREELETVTPKSLMTNDRVFVSAVQAWALDDDNLDFSYDVIESVLDDESGLLRDATLRKGLQDTQHQVARLLDARAIQGRRKADEQRAEGIRYLESQFALAAIDGEELTKEQLRQAALIDPGLIERHQRRVDGDVYTIKDSDYSDTLREADTLVRLAVTADAPEFHILEKNLYDIVEGLSDIDRRRYYTAIRDARGERLNDPFARQAAGQLRTLADENSYEPVELNRAQALLSARIAANDGQDPLADAIEVDKQILDERALKAAQDLLADQEPVTIPQFDARITEKEAELAVLAERAAVLREQALSSRIREQVEDERDRDAAETALNPLDTAAAGIREGGRSIFGALDPNSRGTISKLAGTLGHSFREFVTDEQFPEDLQSSVFDSTIATQAFEAAQEAADEERDLRFRIGVLKRTRKLLREMQESLGRDPDFMDGVYNHTNPR